MKRWSIAAAAAGLLALCVAVPAQAAEWCVLDPELSIQTSPGQSITVFVTEGVTDPQHLPTLALAKISYTTHTARKTSVLVTVYDYVPGDSIGPFETKMMVSSQPFGAGVLYGSAYAKSGRTMSVSFWLHPEKVAG